MSDTDTEPSDDVAAVRAKLLAGLATVEITAKALGKSPRTIQRMIARKEIPVIRIGRKPYPIIEGTREALMASARIGHKPPKRGRPAGRKAA